MLGTPIFPKAQKKNNWGTIIKCFKVWRGTENEFLE